MVRLKKRNIIKPLEFNSVYSKIDTTVLYKDCSNKYKKAIKFYKDGKVGCFFYVDSTDKTTIDPRRALMGKFELKNGKIYMNFIARNSQVGRFLLKEKSINIEDTLLVTIGEGIFNKDTIVYKKKIIPKDWLIYSPDW